MVVSAHYFKSSALIENFKQSKFLIISTCILIFGMLFGALSIVLLKDGLLKFVNDCFYEYLSFRSNAKFFKIFFASFCSGIFYIFVITISSFGLSGFAVTPLLLFLRGFSTCALTGILYKNFSLQGIAFSNLILLPSSLCVDFILIFLSNDAFQLSAKFASIFKDVSFKGIDVKPTCTKLLRSCLICVVALSFASCIEAVFSAGFIKYFNF